MKRSFRMVSLFLVIAMLLAMAASCSGGNAAGTTSTPDQPDTPEHTCSMEWKSNATGHWQACSVSGCSVSGEIAPHEFGKGTTTVNGSLLTYTETCTVCKYQNIVEGKKDVILTFDDLVNAIYDGTVTLASHDISFTTNKTAHYFYDLSKKGTNTLTVKALEATTASFVVTSISDGGRGAHSYIYKNLQVNGSSDGVTYTKGSPTFSGWETPVDIKVATITLCEGINEISFEMGADVRIAGIELQNLKAPVFVTKQADYSPTNIKPLSGEGSEASPWLINTAEDFIAMNAWMKYDATYAKGYYKMTADIDFEGTDFAGINATIGFSGVFDGNGHVVKNLTIDRIMQNNAALFNKVLNGTIKNIGVESGSIEGNNFIGGLIGYAESATVINCFNEADVKGNNEVGGLVGHATGITISNSFNTGKLRLSGKESIGGIIGLAKFTNTINNCYNIGTVGYGTYSGKLVGWANNSTKISNSYYDKTAAPENQPIGTLLTPKGAIGFAVEDFYLEAFVETMNQNLNDGYMTWAYGKDKIARLSTFEENNKIAIFMASVNAVTIKDGKVETIVSEDGGYKTVLYGSDKQSVIALDGTVYQPLTTQTVLLILDIAKADSGEIVDRIERNIEVTVNGKYATSGENAVPNVVPGLREWYGLSGNFQVTSATRIVYETADMKELAERIQTYMKQMLGMTLTVTSGSGKAGDIILRYNPQRLGELGDEGNAIAIGDEIVIEAASETGMFYGAVSIMQILYQDKTHSSIPKGYIRDYPEYAVRGGMIDVARKFFEIDYIEEIGKYMSWFKLNALHLHINEDSGEIQKSFVLESKVYPELNKGSGENVWTQDEYRAMQKELKKFGVNVITEIDTPGHASAFANVPGAPVSGNNFQLNTKYDESLEFVKKLYDELLDGDDPVIQNAYVHIGTDEASTSSENMRRYISDLSQYVLGKENVEKVIFWGNLSLYYGNTEIDPENVAVQIWDSPDYRADEALSNGFDIINSTSNIFYLVPGYQSVFGEKCKFNGYIDLAKFYDIWEGSSDFTTHNQNNPDDWYGRGYYYADHDFLLGDPKILGTLFCNWNDSGIGYTYDLLELMISYMAGISEKCWYGDTDRFASGKDFVEAFNKVGNSAPYANPRYRVDSDSSLVASYDFEETVDGAVKDSANGYHATIQNGAIETLEGNKVLALNGTTSLKMPFKGIGYPYTAAFKIYLDGEQDKDAILFTCDACTFYLNYNGKGVAFASSFYVYGFNVQIPANEWVEIKITSQSPTIVDSQSNITILTINGKEYLPTNILDSRRPSRSSILGTVDTFLGVKGYLDDLVISNKYQFDPVIDAYRFVGEGSESSPYLIQNATDLRMFSVLVNRGDFKDAHFKLTADIDMTDVAYSSIAEFNGVLDGDGHAITGLTINEPIGERVGLIGYLNGGTIKNLGIAKSIIIGKKWVGALAGRTLNATILNCYSIATVKGVDDVGGLVGMFNSSKIENCFSMANVTGTTSVGGIVGSVNTSLNRDNPASFDNVYSMATLKGSNYVGIIAGYDEGVKETVTMKNIYHSSTYPISGSFTRNDGTKLAEEGMTNGNLLDHLNQNVKDGYSTWTASADGYPVFTGTTPDFSAPELPETPETPDDGLPVESKTDFNLLTDGVLVGVSTNEGCLSGWRSGMSATYTFTGNYEGTYDLIVYYADPQGWKLNVLVNGTTYRQQIFGKQDAKEPAATDSWSAEDAKSYTFTVELVNGENTIIFTPTDSMMGNIVDFDLVRHAD